MEEGRAKFIDWYLQNYGIVKRPLCSSTAPIEPSPGLLPVDQPRKVMF
jgi:hypothetical protein